MTTLPVFVSESDNQTAAAGSITVNAPSGDAAGSRGLIIRVGCATSGATWAAPADAVSWSGPYGATGRGATFIKVGGSSEPSTYTFTRTGGGGTLRITCERWTSYDATTFVPSPATTGIAGTDVTSANAVSPAVTATQANTALSCGLVNLASNTSSVTKPASMTQTYQFTTTAFRAGAVESVGSGSTGTRTWTSPLATSYTSSVAINPLAAIDYTVSSDLVGDGVASRGILDIAESKALVGDGIPTRTVAEATARDLVGDGVVTRQLAAAVARDLIGDGQLTRQVDGLVPRDVNGDGTVSRGPISGDVHLSLSGDGIVDTAKAVTAAKTFDLVGDGATTETHAQALLKAFALTGDGMLSETHPVDAARTFDLTGVGELVDLTITIPLSEIPTGDCPADWPTNDGLKAISGVVYDHEDGSVVAGAQVCLVRDSDAFQVTCMLSAGDGSYSFPRDTNDPYTYHVVSTTATQQGMSEPGCVPS